MAILSPPGRTDTVRHTGVAAPQSRFELTLLDGFRLEWRGRPIQVPPAARKLITSSAELYARIKRIDEGSLDTVVPQSPARALMGRLERGLSGQARPENRLPPDLFRNIAAARRH